MHTLIVRDSPAYICRTRCCLSGRKRSPHHICSGSLTSVNQSQADPTRYLCVVVDITDAGGKTLHHEVTPASDMAAMVDSVGEQRRGVAHEFGRGGLPHSPAGRWHLEGTARAGDAACCWSGPQRWCVRVSASQACTCLASKPNKILSSDCCFWYTGGEWGTTARDGSVAVAFFAALFDK